MIDASQRGEADDQDDRERLRQWRHECVAS